MNLSSIAFAEVLMHNSFSQCNRGWENSLVRAPQVVESAGKQTMHWELWIQVFLRAGTQYGWYTYICWCNFPRVFQKIHHHVLFQMNMSRTYQHSWTSFLIYWFVLEVVSIIGNCLRWSWRSCTCLDVVNFGMKKIIPKISNEQC